MFFANLVFKGFGRKNSPFRRFARDRAGAMAVTVALMMTAMGGMAALAVDVTDWYGSRRAMQSAADAAALGGALALFEGSTDAQARTAATTDANLNKTGFATGATLNVSIDDNTDSVTATLTKRADLLFSALFLGSAPTLSVTATAGTAGGGGPICLLLTNPSGSNVLSLSGSSSIQASGCNVVVNSTSTSAMNVSGNTRVNAKGICGPGGHSASGSSSYNPPPTQCAAMADPLANVPVPTAATGACNYTNFQTFGNNFFQYTDPSTGHLVSDTTGITIPPFNYSGGALYMSPGVYCGGISFTATTNVVFNPGIYVLRNGGLNTSGNATATGNGVSFYITGTGTAVQLADDLVDLSASTTLTITAPTTGPLAGIAIYEDHTAATGTITNTLSGNSTVNFTGVLYFGNQNVVVSGSSENQSAGFTSMVAYSINYSGSSTLYLNSNYASTTVPLPSGMRMPVVALLQ